MLNQLQIHLDSKFEAIQTFLVVLESWFNAMDRKMVTLTADIAYIKAHLLAPHASR